MCNVREEMKVCVNVTFSSILHLLKELVGWVLITVLLHLGQVALLRGDGSIHLEGSQTDRGAVSHICTDTLLQRLCQYKAQSDILDLLKLLLGDF